MGDIEPDTKDWTWVLGRRCPECGFEADAVPRSGLGARIRADALGWSALLVAPGATTRPRPGAWSTAEYAAHVRDVHRVFTGRLAAMLAADDPVFDDWDQDATALEQRYDLQDPAEIGPALTRSAHEVAAAYDAVPDDAWGRRGRRSNGSVFTVESLGRYHLHDVVHHAWDVRDGAGAATLDAYQRDAVGYRDATVEMPDAVRSRLEAFAARVGPGARVLEIGSGPGRDALHLEQRGVGVRRTDVAPAFVALLRADGHRADVVDPRRGDLGDPDRPGVAYDGVWANACLLHVDRDDLPGVLSRLGAATRPGGPLELSVKEGDGDVWSRHGAVRAARRFVLWRAGPLRAALTTAGWDVETIDDRDGRRGERWLMVSATRRV